ncbi:MAG: recombination regulator RecX [Megasphaera cerevisiae]|jgi:regulatory protein|nr:recombination regulator RecX [Megasphaera cerevisiae]
MNRQETYAQALRLLNIRFLSEGELRKKLCRKGADDENIRDVMELLKREHFIDDMRLARDVYRYYAAKGQYGHLYITGRLQRRCLPVPEDVERPDEYGAAAALVNKRFSGNNTDKRKIARFLQYRGFSVSVIRDILMHDEE